MRRPQEGGPANAVAVRGNAALVCLPVIEFGPKPQREENLEERLARVVIAQKVSHLTLIAQVALGGLKCGQKAIEIAHIVISPLVASIKALCGNFVDQRCRVVIHDLQVAIQTTGNLACATDIEQSAFKRETGRRLEFCHALGAQEVDAAFIGLPAQGFFVERSGRFAGLGISRQGIPPLG